MLRRTFLLMLLLLGIAIIGVAMLFLREKLQYPISPAGYQNIHLGMTTQEVENILGPPPPDGGGGYCGWYEDNQRDAELRNAEFRKANGDYSQWSGRFRRVNWRGEIWVITITFNGNNSVAGKSLIRLDRRNELFLNKARRWLGV